MFGEQYDLVNCSDGKKVTMATMKSSLNEG